METTANKDSISVCLADQPEEIKAAQHLRYKVFYEEHGARPTKEIAREKRDFDEFDSIADHLIVVDNSIDKNGTIVGTYRLLRREAAERHGGFYTNSEYDITPLLTCGHSLLELGRSCVLPEYRTRPVMQLLWQGIADYIFKHEVELMFGCASIHETDISRISSGLAYMHHFHLAPEELRPRALEKLYIDMDLMPIEDINPRQEFSALPPLIKGYLRLGASIGEGAIIDPVFQTTDVCIVLPTHLVTSRYRKHYERSVNQQETAVKESGAESESANMAE